MFVAKLMIRNKDREQVLADNPNADFLRNAFGMTANFRARAKLGFGAERPRVFVFSWDDYNVSDVERFKKFFDEFVAPADYAFVASFDDEDKVRDGGLLKGTAEVRKTVGLNGSLVAGTTEKLSHIDMGGD